jgi:hypothetical protein
LPQSAEYLLKIAEAFDENRSVDWAAERAADEGGARRRKTRNGLIWAALFLDL